MPSPNSDLLATYDQAFAGRSWHRTPLVGSLRGLAPEGALRRPAPGRHNIWELVLHCAYWKFEVRRRITGDERSNFPRDGLDLPELPAGPDLAGWNRGRAWLRREHFLLRAVVEGLTADPAAGRIAVGMN